LVIQGLQGPVELAPEERFDKIRHRVNQALTGTNMDGEPADKKKRSRPLHKLSFKTVVMTIDEETGEEVPAEDEDGNLVIGRITFAPDSFRCLISDEEKDAGVKAEDDELEEEEDEDGE
jgi:hypothetical protein